MRLSIFILLSVASVLAACADPDEPDAGTPADSGVAVDAGATRDSGGAVDGSPADLGADAQVADAAPDAGPSDANPGDARPGDAEPGMDVVATDSGPRVGPVTIQFEAGSSFGTSGVAIFQDSSGNLLRTRTTTTGEIVETIEEGSMVTITAELAPSQNGDVITVVGIAPGEVYRVTRAGSPPIVGQMSFGAGEAFPGAVRYGFELGCTGAGFTDPTLSFGVNIYDDCFGSGTTMDVLFLAFDANDQRIAHRSIRNVPFVQGAEVLPSNPWRTDFDDLTLDLSNPPVDGLYVATSLGVALDGRLYDYEGELLDLLGGAVHQDLRRPRFGDGIAYRHTMLGTRTDTWVQQSAAPVANQSFDLSTDFLPFPGPVTLTSSALPGRPQADWPSVAGLDFVALQVLSIDLTLSWVVFLRGDASSFTFPELPPELSTYQPAALGDLIGDLRVIDAEHVTDYAGSKAIFGQSLLDWEPLFFSGRLPPATRVRGGGRVLVYD